MSKKRLPVQRAPAGVVTGRPVLMRLLPTELTAVQRRAKARNTSMSACARELTVIGLRSCDSDESVTQNV